jgi:hypothetical protein
MIKGAVMRMIIIVTCLLLATTTTVWGIDPGQHQNTTKGSSHLGSRLASDAREGGETIEDAVVIPSVPYSDTGATCDNLHDYDEACPYLGSISPDVVYAFTPPTNMSLDIDLCDSQYDTKVYVYEDQCTPGNPLACNDDYCANEWTDYASRLRGVPVLAGHVYYIVIDGYGGDCGLYQVDVTEYVPCDIDCPPGGWPECEPPPFDGYVDHYNSGCGHDPPLFQDIIATGDDCATLCGVSGWYFSQGGLLYRDTDWFLVNTITDQLDVSLTPEQPTILMISAPDPDCATMPFDVIQIADECETFSVTVPAVPGASYWIWIGPTVFEDLPDYEYVLDVCGIFSPIALEPASWGQVKAKYR